MSEYTTISIVLRVPTGDYCYRQGGPLCGQLIMSGGRAVCQAGFEPRAEGEMNKRQLFDAVRKSPACASRPTALEYRLVSEEDQPDERGK